MRRLLCATGLALAAFAAPSAHAAPPYCVTVTDSSGTLATTCAITTSCVVEGTVLPSTVVGFAYCVRWP